MIGHRRARGLGVLGLVLALLLGCAGSAEVGRPDRPTSEAEPTPTSGPQSESAGGANNSAGSGSAGGGDAASGSTGAGVNSGAGAGSRAGTGAPARTMDLLIDADITWSDPTGCTITTTTMHARIALNFHANGLVDGISDESSMGHTPVTRCGENHMGNWTTIEAPIVTVLPSYWDHSGIHLRLDWWDVTEIAISTGPVQQAATVAVARDSWCTDWPGNLFLFLIPSDWDSTRPAQCEFESSSGSGEVFLAITQVDGEEVWRSIPDFLEHLTVPTDAEYETILDARAEAEAALEPES